MKKLIKNMTPIINRQIKSKAKEKAGKAPGTLIYTGERKDAPIRISQINYNLEKYEQSDIEKLKEITSHENSDTISWINFDGVHDTKLIEEVGKKFKLDSLILEDIISIEQRPKIELYDDTLVVFLKMLYMKDDKLVIEHISLILSENYILSFQEHEEDIFDSVRSRIKNSSGRIRKRSADYLLFALMDAVVDHYFIVLDDISEKLEDLEDELMLEPKQELLHRLQFYRKQVVEMRRSIYPLREVVSKLSTLEYSNISLETERYFRDLYDHTIQIIETIETFKETIASLKDIFMSGVSNRMNEVMKVLTIIATIFIPLTFIAGVYGMNFEHMPELSWEYGYLYVWLVMIALLGGMVVYFKKKKWF